MSGLREYRKLASVQNVSPPIGIKNAKLIPLTQGKFAIVDEADYGWLMQWKWFALKDTNTYYAARYVYGGYKKSAMMQMHRDLLGLKKYDGEIVDHINRNGLDNRRINIRVASCSLNAINSTGRGRPSSSGFRGVCWNKVNNKWTARITVRKEVIFIGHFKSVVEAAYEYDLAAIEYWGEDAPLNFPRWIYEEAL